MSNKIAFHLQLLSTLLDMQQYPFVKMVIDKGISKEEYEEIFTMTKKLEGIYIRQKEEGLLDFTSLLIQFAGMLNDKLNPDETIYALHQEGYFPALMAEFITLIEARRKN